MSLAGTLLLSGDQIGLGEVLPLEQQGFRHGFGQGIRKAISEVEACQVAAFVIIRALLAGNDLIAQGLRGPVPAILAGSTSSMSHPRYPARPTQPAYAARPTRPGLRGPAYAARPNHVIAGGRGVTAPPYTGHPANDVWGIDL